MSTIKSGLAAACVASALSFAAPALAAGPSHIGIDLDDHVVLRWEAPFGRAATVLEILPDGTTADVGAAVGDVVFYQVPKGSVLAVTDLHWTVSSEDDRDGEFRVALSLDPLAAEQAGRANVYEAFATVQIVVDRRHSFASGSAHFTTPILASDKVAPRFVHTGPVNDFRIVGYLVPLEGVNR